MKTTIFENKNYHIVKNDLGIVFVICKKIGNISIRFKDGNPIDLDKRIKLPKYILNLLK